MNKIFLTLILSVFISLKTYSQTTITERQGEPDIYNVDSEDAEMNEAIKKSRQTFNDFIDVFQNPKRNQTDFSVKMPFPASNGVEHIWLINIETKKGKLYGQVGNVPDDVTTIKIGDKVEIMQSRISDWFYIQDNTLIGGLTIRVLRDRMAPSEKRQLDSEFGVKF